MDQSLSDSVPLGRTPLLLYHPRTSRGRAHPRHTDPVTRKRVSHQHMAETDTAEARRLAERS